MSKSLRHRHNIEGTVLLIEPQNFSYLLIVEGTDGYRGQAKGGSLKVDILPGVAYLHVDVTFPSIAINPEGALIVAIP